MTTSSSAAQAATNIYKLKLEPRATRDTTAQGYVVNPYDGSYYSGMDFNTFTTQLWNRDYRYRNGRAGASATDKAEYDEIVADLSTKNWVKQDSMFLDSYEKYGDAWNNLWSAEYKNPRMEEEYRNKNKRDADLNNQRATLASGLEDLVIQANSMPSSKKSRGTGVNSRADIFAGGLEAGLGV